MCIRIKCVDSVLLAFYNGAYYHNAAYLSITVDTGSVPSEEKISYVRLDERNTISAKGVIGGSSALIPCFP